MYQYLVTNAAHHVSRAVTTTTTTIIMTDTSGAYAAKAGDTDFRKKWDKQEYTERARKKDDEERERMQENEERMKQGASTTPSPQFPIVSLNSHRL